VNALAAIPPHPDPLPASGEREPATLGNRFDLMNQTPSGRFVTNIN
jgi:hypothetical protein